jgi:glutathione peroxidase
MASVYDFTVKNIRSQPVSLADYADKVLLIANTASRCGFTPQYAELQSLYERFRGRGFELLAFPCDQFGHQEPGDGQQIETFCTTRFSVTFPLFEKIDVNGKDTTPLFAYLKAAAPGLLGTRRIKWNFTKFLVARDGRSVERFAPMSRPNSLIGKLEQLLAQPTTLASADERRSESGDPERAHGHREVGYSPK